MAACIARRIVEIEEGEDFISTMSDPDPASTVTDDADIDTPLVSEFARVHHTTVLLPDGIGNKAELIYRRCGTEKDGPGSGSGSGSWVPETAEINLVFGRVSSVDLKGCVIMQNRRDDITK